MPRFGAQQQPCKGLSAHQRRRIGVQPGDGPLGVCDVGGDRAAEDEAPPDERIRYVRFVFAGSTVVARQAETDVAVPAPPQDRRHGCSLFKIVS
jgi:hypothetical protein